MGIVTVGIPAEITIKLARLGGAVVFIETGTYHGDTTRWASSHFNSVHTVERAEYYYDLCSSELAEIKGVTPHLGDSRTILPKILHDIGDQAAVFWLDGHWSGGETAGENDECPLLDELACLVMRLQDIILIDDARLFLCAPPLPHKPSQWPTIAEIIAALPKSGTRHFVQVIDDVIYIIPNEDNLKNCLLNYAQNRSTLFWAEFSRLQRSKISLGSRLKSGLRKIKQALTG